MSFEWPTDTVTINLQIYKYSGSLRLQFEAGSGKVGKNITVAAS